MFLAMSGTSSSSGSGSGHKMVRFSVKQRRGRVEGEGERGGREGGRERERKRKGEGGKRGKGRGKKREKKREGGRGRDVRGEERGEGEGEGEGKGERERKKWDRQKFLKGKKKHRTVAKTLHQRNTTLCTCITHQSNQVLHDCTCIVIFTIRNLLKELLYSRTTERSRPHYHLIQNDSHRPPVHRVPVSLTQDDLRCNVVWSTVHLCIMELAFVRFYHVCCVCGEEGGA